MNADVLLEHFHRLGDAPDAVPRLRRFILDLAVRGKLVAPQVGDESSALLLKRIAKDLGSRIASGEFKEPKSFIDLPIEELPFSVPEHWAWVRLITVAEVSYGYAFDSNRFNSQRKGMPLIRIRDISKTDTEAYTDENYDAFYVVKQGDMLIGMDGDFNIRKWKGGDALLNQRVCRIRDWRHGLVDDFMTIPLQMILLHLHGATSLTTVKHLSAKQLNGVYLPLPPLPEQHRIVAKVDELMALCDRLEAAQQEREQRRTRLTAASWQALTTESDPNAARFALEQLPALTTRPQQIAALRQTILDLAVRGRLVKQDATDESAEVLLKRIAKEKERLLNAGLIMREKAIIPAKASDLSFKLRHGWQPAKISQVIVETQTGPFGSSLHQSDYVKGGVPVINPASIKDGKIVPIDSMAIGKATLERLATFKLREGDIVMGRRGEMGRCARVTKKEVGWLCGTGSLILRLPSFIHADYFVMLVGSPFVRAYLTGSAVGATMQNLNQSILLNLIIGLPPLAEQRRIVAKVDELMRLCDALEAALVRGEAVKGRLLEAVLHTEVLPRTQPPAPVPLGVATGAPKPQRAYVEAEVELAMAAEPVAGLVKRGPGRPRKAAAASENNTAEAILGYLHAHAGWHGKAAILEATGVEASEWNAAIKELLEAGKVERQGEKKGARYKTKG